MASNKAIQKQFFGQFVKDVKIKATEEFDRNFERKAFFDQRWPKTKHPVKRGSLMMRTGTLRRSINSQLEEGENGAQIKYTSNVGYASAHNEGATIEVTKQMKKFFWAMYYKALGGRTKKKDGSVSASKRNQLLSADAEYWKSLALMKEGSMIKIPERRFIGEHQDLDQIIRDIANKTLKEIEVYLYNEFKNRFNPNN